VCAACGWKYSGQVFPRRNCRSVASVKKAVDRLSTATGCDLSESYGLAAHRWYFASEETRTPDEVEFCVSLCREDVCGKYSGGLCKPSCGPGMLVEVKAYMASEGCPWVGQEGLGPRW